MPKTNNHYSEEAQEILGIIPRWIIRWGITLIFIIFICIILGCYFIKYPQIVEAPIIVTTINPPADLIVRSSGRIQNLYVSDSQSVLQGEVIAVLNNVASYTDVTKVYERLKKSIYQPAEKIVREDWINEDYQMGELQGAFLNFQQICRDYYHYLSSSNIEKKKILLQAQITKNKEYYNKLVEQQATQIKETYYTNLNLSRDSILFERGIISQENYELAISSYLQKQSSNKSFEASLTNTELSILQKEQQLIELDIQKQNEIAEYERVYSNNLQQLMAEIEKWHYEYVITSPLNGRVAFTKYWSNNQTLQVGDRIATIIPEKDIKIIGRLFIPSNGLGKVKKGQIANIKLNGFPHLEFGKLKGQITSISEVPDENAYIAEVNFPEGFITTYKIELPLILEMDGTGEIITQDQRLIQRFLQPIRFLFNQ